MLKQTYFNRFRGWGEKPSKDVIIVDVRRTVNYILSPSKELLLDYQEKRISWNQYVVRFKKEMNNEACKSEMRKIKDISKSKDVWLVCSCWNKENRCHRFILMELIDNL